MPVAYPIFLNLANRLCIVVGGGDVASRKAAGVLRAGGQVRVVSPLVSPPLRNLADDGTIELSLREYVDGDLEGATLVFAATSDREVNAQVAAEAHRRQIPANVTDLPAEGDFAVPAVMRRGEMCIAVSTGGGSPMLAAAIRDELGRRYPADYGAFVELLGEMRTYIKESSGDANIRRAALAALIDSEQTIREALALGGVEAGRAECERIAARELELAAQNGLAQPE